jgi:thiol-disulfide isomerase/thioredoxin
MRRAALLVLGLVACGSRGPADRAAASATNPTPESQVVIGDKAPGFSLDSVNGSGKLGIAPGKVNLVVFWATWHGPSKAMFPRLDELREKYEARGLAIAAISVDDDDGDALVADAARTWGGKFPVARDRGHVIANRWHMALFPTIVIVDRSGVVRARRGGWREGDAAEVERVVVSLL